MREPPPLQRLPIRIDADGESETKLLCQLFNAIFVLMAGRFRMTDSNDLKSPLAIAALQVVVTCPHKLYHFLS